jgi:hypothetical protein
LVVQITLVFDDPPTFTDINCRWSAYNVLGELRPARNQRPSTGLGGVFLPVDARRCGEQTAR